MSKPIRKILIVGGGTAGWMTAATLARFLTGREVGIQVIESDAIGPVGVGEATVPGIAQLHQFLGIRELDFIKATQATFKLGIKFEGWSGSKPGFFHPFAAYGAPIDGHEFYQCWLKAKTQGYDIPLEQFCLGAQLADKGRFVQPDSQAKNTLAWFNYAYHFDASLYAKFLRTYAEQNGVARVEGKINHVAVNADNGFIDSVYLESGENLAAELFIDCTGFSALLIEKTLKTGYTNWSQWLPCNCAVAVQTTNHQAPLPYTRSITRDAGWQWQIPLQHRAGNGYVYCDSYSSDEQAMDTLLSHLDGSPLISPRVIKFTTGMRKQFWSKNCVALGLASGFLEPLESTSISLIQTGIAKLMQCWPDSTFSPDLIAEANRLNELEYTHIRDFIILHYYFAGRADTPFWQQVTNMSLPESLQEKIARFKVDGQVLIGEQETFEAPSWISIYNGLDVSPQGRSRSVEVADANRLCAIMERMRSAIAAAIPHAPTHAEFLSQL